MLGDFLMKVVHLLLAGAALVMASFWMEDIKHQGIASFNPDPVNYPVFRNVRDYGAQGDGIHDDTDAINLAINASSRCGGSASCGSSTITPAVVYFPAGTYLISDSIIDYYYTQLIGDPNAMPTIKGSPNFHTIRLGLVDADLYYREWLKFRSTNVFFRQIRNLIFDTSNIPGVVSALHWPSAQATSVQNCYFILSSRPGDTHTGIFIEEGSGGTMADLTFYGGKFGVQFGNQQYTIRNLTFWKSDTAILQLWDWGWTYKSLNIFGCRVGINMSANAIGSVIVLDSLFQGVETALITGRDPANTTGQGSLVLQNVELSEVGTLLQGRDGRPILVGHAAGLVFEAGYIMGNVYEPHGPLLTNGPDENFNNRPAALLVGNAYYGRSKPQYQHTPAPAFISARTSGAAGDGVTDDTEALNRLFRAASTGYANGAIAFVDAGYYRVSDTVYIPPNTRVVGESLASVILASGSKFSNINFPWPVVQIGKSGESGVVEMSDMIVSTQGGMAGAVMIEYNINSPGQLSGLWDVHVRIGGFRGSELQAAQCPKTPETATVPKSACIAAYMSMHITKTANNLYMENNWLWVADHDMDDYDESQINVFAGRGLLIDSTEGKIFLVGTAVEHHTLYQYQLVDTQDIWMGQIQTESPYYQPNPPAPAPFNSRNIGLNDPDFELDCQRQSLGADGTLIPLALPGDPPCEAAWGLRVLRSKNVAIYGAGLYSFFNNYNLTCSTHKSGENCQARILWVTPTSPITSAIDVLVYNLNTIGTVSMITRQGDDVAMWDDNVATFASTVVMFKS